MSCFEQGDVPTCVHVAITTGDGLAIARVVEQQKSQYRILFAGKYRHAKLSGRFEFLVDSELDFPAVGDYVAFRGGAQSEDMAIIERIESRENLLTRSRPGAGHLQQALVANVDSLIVVSAVGQEFNPSRLDRYVAMALAANVKPILVISKCDLESDLTLYRDRLTGDHGFAQIHFVSSVTGHGLDQIKELLVPGKTLALTGSSGVGKSTLINALTGMDLLTKSVSAHLDRGQHTTTARCLYLLENGTQIIDTPGIKELGTVSSDQDSEQFADIEALLQTCRYTNCSHGSEDQCGIQSALSEGRLTQKRWQSWQKLQREKQFWQRKESRSEQNSYRQKWKKIAKSNRKNYKLKQRQYK